MKAVDGHCRMTHALEHYGSTGTDGSGGPSTDVTGRSSNLGTLDPTGSELV